MNRERHLDESSAVAIRSTIRLLVADDHRWIREGVRCATQGTEIEIVGEAATGLETIDSALRLDFDVLLLDLSMPECDGFDVLETLTSKRREMRILVYSNHDRKDFRARAGRLSARGYLLKDVDRQGLIDAIREISRGGNLWDAPTSGDEGAVSKDGNT